jgi:2Fe-2S ferredoxin
VIDILFTLDNGETRLVVGEEGFSVMEVATLDGVPGINSDCGGSLSCGTCHAYLEDSCRDRVPPPGEEELAMLENVINPRPNSRLTCQLSLTPQMHGIRFEVPASPF